MDDKPDSDRAQIVSISMDLTQYLQRFRLRENGGRRLGVDRRQYGYTLHIPERRSGYDRRVEKDRRKTPRVGSRLALPSQPQV